MKACHHRSITSCAVLKCSLIMCTAHSIKLCYPCAQLPYNRDAANLPPVPEDEAEIKYLPTEPKIRKYRGPQKGPQKQKLLDEISIAISSPMETHVKTDGVDSDEIETIENDDTPLLELNAVDPQINQPSETPIYNYINPALRARPTTCLFPYNKRNSSSSTPEPPIQSPPYISISSTSQIPVQSSSKTTIPSPQNIVPENNQPSLTNIGYIRQNDPGIGFQRESFITMPVKAENQAPVAINRVQPPKLKPVGNFLNFQQTKLSQGQYRNVNMKQNLPTIPGFTTYEIDGTEIKNGQTVQKLIRINSGVVLNKIVKVSGLKPNILKRGPSNAHQQPEKVIIRERPLIPKITTIPCNTNFMILPHEEPITDGLGGVKIEELNK